MSEQTPRRGATGRKWTRGEGCECDVSCAEHPSGGQCHLNGTPHTHPEDGRGNYGPCPVHPHAPSAPRPADITGGTP